MVRKIIRIDEEKCNGCGVCVTACHEGAIELVDGKAKLVREHFCDGLGDCLPECPTGAIAFEEREAPAYDSEGVAAARKKKEEIEMLKKAAGPALQGCPGTRMRQMDRSHGAAPLGSPAPGAGTAPTEDGGQRAAAAASQLAQWPCQIKLVPEQAPFFQGAKLLIAADCTAYAYANVHQEFMRGKVTIIGCPKLDGVDYSEKLTGIIRDNDIRSVTILRMEVPCCGGLQMAAEKALRASGKFIPWQVVTISVDGRILD